MWSGNAIDLGPMALLRVCSGVEGVRVIVASAKMQAGDQAIFRHLGIEPAEQKILALKISVHFRADFQPIAAEVLVVAAPGPVTADPAQPALPQPAARAAPATPSRIERRRLLVVRERVGVVRVEQLGVVLLGQFLQAFQ